jgi:hypothetical protein
MSTSVRPPIGGSAQKLEVNIDIPGDVERWLRGLNYGRWGVLHIDFHDCIRCSA